MNDNLKTALGITDSSISQFQAEINTKYETIQRDRMQANIAYEQRKARRLEDARERQIVLIEELNLYNSDLNYDSLGITQPSDEELLSITNKLINMTEEEKKDTTQKINNHVSRLLIQYYTNNGRTEGIRHFLKIGLRDAYMI